MDQPVEAKAPTDSAPPRLTRLLDQVHDDLPAFGYEADDGDLYIAVRADDIHPLLIELERVHALVTVCSLADDEGNSDLYEAARAEVHPLVQQIGDGMLPLEKFCRRLERIRPDEASIDDGDLDEPPPAPARRSPGRDSTSSEPTDDKT